TPSASGCDGLDAGTAGSESQLPHPGLSRSYGLLSRLGTEGQAFDINDLHIGHPHEAENSLQIGDGMVHAYGGTFRINAAACHDEVDLLARGKTHRAVFRVAEGEAGPRDAINPALQC